MHRLSIRLKVTLAFSVAIAVLFTGLGLFIYLTLRADLNRTVEQGLQSRAADVSALIREADSGLQSGGSPLTRRGEGFAQVLNAQGQVVDSSPRLRRAALLDRGELVRARVRATFVDKGRPLLEEESRLLSLPARGADQQRLVIVVGTSLESRDEALRKLAGLLLIGFPIALGLASLAGYGAAAAALRPVESMRRRAGEISGGSPGQRLPVPVAQDEVHRLGETLNLMLGRLEDALEHERRFVADASHELRTPLAILKAELELARRAGRSMEELQAAVGSAAEETDRLAQLAEDLLVIARGDQGRLPVRPARLTAIEVFDDVRGRFAERAREAGREIVVGADSPVALTGDPLRIGQALGNLVDNALRYGEGAVHLEARRVADDATELRVRDEGPGFPPALLEHAFERFTRSDHARGRGGAGLGLAIVAAIAQAHGGSVQAHNGRGDRAGAVVSLTLPDATS